jgi:tRNA pseudouridine13 synthase
MDAVINYKLKITPSDFLVSEALILPPESAELNDQYYYYLLKKCGYTTFQTIECLAKDLSLDHNLIGYAGLKDEDGITEQHISLPIKIKNTVLENFNKTNLKGKFKFLELNYLQKGSQPLQVGNLLGNNFRIVVRNLSEVFAKKFDQIKKFSSFFVNYYGPQRFGFANAEKNTHLIGEKLVNSDYAKDLIPNISQRELAFYQNSFYSFLWNEYLKKLITVQKAKTINQTQHGISYFYLINPHDKCQLIKNSPTLLQTKMILESGKIKKIEAQRKTMEQANVLCQRIFPDSFHRDAWAIEIDFFLPSGSYATIAVPQILHDFETTNFGE